MREKSESIFYNVDWFTVVIYLLLIGMGWMNIYSAVYDPATSNVFDVSRQESKQMIFIGISIVLAFSILIMDASFFTATAFFLYGGIILLNIAVRFLGSDIRGSHSWFKIGSLSMQPAEFAKWATGLALAKYLSGVTKSDYLKKLFTTIGIIALPVLVIVFIQNETGCALVFVAFIFVLYREGIIPGYILLFGIIAAIAGVVGIKYPGTVVTLDGVEENAKIISIGFDKMVITIWCSVLGAIGIFRLLLIRRTLKQILFTVIVFSVFTGIFMASPVVLEKLPYHMKGRIKCWLGLKVSRAIHDK
jgi:cell division protein FtsW (lipid II flippase)